MQKSLNSFEKLFAEHEKKLADYIADPYAYHNKGILANAPSDEIRQKIIQGRIEELKSQIAGHKSRIQQILKELSCR